MTTDTTPPRTHTPDRTNADGSTTIKLKRACNGCGQLLGDVDNRDVIILLRADYLVAQRNRRGRRRTSGTVRQESGGWLTNSAHRCRRNTRLTQQGVPCPIAQGEVSGVLRVFEGGAEVEGRRHRPVAGSGWPAAGVATTDPATAAQLARPTAARPQATSGNRAVSPRHHSCLG